MILRNFYTIQLARMMIHTKTTQIAFKNCSGSAVQCNYYDNMFAPEYIMTQFSSGYTKDYGIHIGSGTEQPTLDDYILDNRIDNANFSASSSVTTEIVEGDRVICKAVCTITNISSSPFTISEIGLATKYSATYVMIDRSLLETPITLEPNGVAQLTYKIEHKFYQG